MNELERLTQAMYEADDALRAHRRVSPSGRLDGRHTCTNGARPCDACTLEWGQSKAERAILTHLRDRRPR